MAIIHAKELFGGANQTAPGLSDYEIAAAMGLSRTRVFQLPMRAMKKIREAVLEDPELRELAEEVTGQRLPAV